MRHLIGQQPGPLGIRIAHADLQELGALHGRCRDIFRGRHIAQTQGLGGCRQDGLALDHLAVGLRQLLGDVDVRAAGVLLLQRLAHDDRRGGLVDAGHLCGSEIRGQCRHGGAGEQQPPPPTQHVPDASEIKRLTLHSLR